jgi:hypothetical protein
MVEQEQDIGKEFYMFESARTYENIYKVKLDSVSKRKIRNKDEYELSYNFKSVRDDSSVVFEFKGFFLNKSTDNPYLYISSKEIDRFTHIYYYVYSLDNEFILDEINKKKINIKFKEINRDIESMITLFKKDKDINKLEKVLNFMKSLDKENK